MSSNNSKTSSKTSVGKTNSCSDPDWEITPQFIYGGPFIKPKKAEPFIDTAAPRNLQLSGTFKKSYAYYSLKEKIPIILTRVIDYLSRDSSTIKSANSANDSDIKSYLQYVTKLKNDVVTNKEYSPFTVDTPDAKKWNEWIEAQDQKKYFNNTWLFTECYIYRRLREGCELAGSLNKFDPFDTLKNESFTRSLEPMCIVAEKLVTMLPESEKDKRKADFVTLLKICLWANKIDLSFSAGEQVTLEPKIPEKKPEVKKPEEKPEGKGKGKGVAKVVEEKIPSSEPFQMVLDLKDKLIVDDSNKIADAVVNKAEAIRKAIEANTTFKAKCSCQRLATLAKMPIFKKPESEVPAAHAPVEGAEEPEAPKIPCPAKMTVAQSVFFDIICDNAGYELFTDLCLAHFLVSQKIVEKVRFHVKAMPWFVSDATERDFKYVIDSCTKANFNKTMPPEPKPAPVEGAPEQPEEPPRVVTADSLRSLGEQWKQLVDEGVFLVMAEDFWTWPHIYKDMKQRDYNLYRKLQLACALLFKGDLNYRKLLGEKRWNPYLGFEASLQGFIPAPIIAARVVKSELISGMPKGKFEVISKIDDKWMEKGDYGVIQFCGKGEALKVSTVPCLDYGTTCFSTECPVHADM